MMVRRLAVMGCIVLCGVALSGAPQDEVTLLRWAGPPGSRPGTFKEWIAVHPYTNFFVKTGKMVIGDGRSGTVAIITEESIASSLTNELDQLILDLQQEGYTVMSYEVSGGTPDSLRSFLYDLYNSDGIEGALFIGNLPVAWFQVADDFNEYGYAEWPVDLFYMDLDGEWSDDFRHVTGGLVPGQDSIFDGHSGNLSPEIYIGRLLPTGIGNDTLLIKNYLTKDDAYRHSNIELQHRALVYVDDDWEYWAPSWSSNVSLLYDNVLCVSDPNTTRASDYRVRLDTVRAWVSVFAHSWPGGHQFYYNDHNSVDYYWSSEYTSQDPPANFYNHFACSFARYTENGYGGGRTIFNQSYGVGAIGSTKTGSMLEFYFFYLPLSQEKTIGEAFREWFAHITQWGVTFDELCWHYGMTLLGDPFLKPSGHDLSSRVCTLSVADGCGPPLSEDNPINIELDNPMGITGVQFLLKFDGSLLTVDSIVTTTRSSFMNLGYSICPDSVRISMLSTVRDSILPGEGPIVEVLFDVDDGAVFGDSTQLQLEDCVLSGAFVQSIFCVSENGLFYFINVPPIPSPIIPDSGSFISDNTPLFDWCDATCATKYRLQIEDDIGFSSPLIDDSTLTSSVYIPTSPLADSLYYWRVCAGNRFGWSDWSSPFNLTIDTRPPVIESTTVWCDTSYMGPFEIYTDVGDVNGVDSVYLCYRTDIGPEWTYLQMTPIETVHYFAEIPELGLHNTLVSYYIRACDIAIAPNVSTDPPNAPDSCYIFTAGLVGVEDAEDDKPSEFFAGQNYPNPFFKKTTISFGLPVDSRVYMAIYDILGKRVATLVDEQLKAGYHEIEWNGIGNSGRRLPAGIYFYHMRAGKFESTRKMFIVR